MFHRDVKRCNGTEKLSVDQYMVPCRKYKMVTWALDFTISIKQYTTDILKILFRVRMQRTWPPKANFWALTSL